MVRRTIYCDRCGKEIEDFINNRGFNIFRKYLLKRSTGIEDRLDLCQQCYDDLSDWVNNSKENDR